MDVVAWPFDALTAQLSRSRRFSRLVRFTGQAETMRHGRRLHAVLDTELAQDVRDVDARGLAGDEQGVRDLLVGAAGRDEADDLAFAFGQARRCRPGPPTSGRAAASSIRAWRASCSMSRRNGAAPSRTAAACASRRAVGGLGAIAVGREDGFGGSIARVGRRRRPAKLVPAVRRAEDLRGIGPPTDALELEPAQAGDGHAPGIGRHDAFSDTEQAVGDRAHVRFDVAQGRGVLAGLRRLGRLGLGAQRVPREPAQRGIERQVRVQRGERLLDGRPDRRQ